MKMFYWKVHVVVVIYLFALSTTFSISASGSPTASDNQRTVEDEDPIVAASSDNINTSGKQQTVNQLEDKFQKNANDPRNHQRMDGDNLFQLNKNTFKTMFPSLTKLLQFWFHPSNVNDVSSTLSEPIMENSNIMQVYANQQPHIVGEDKTEDESVKRLVRQNPILFQDLVGQFQRMNKEVVNEWTPTMLQQIPFLQQLPLFSQRSVDAVGSTLGMARKPQEMQNANNDGTNPTTSSSNLGPDSKQMHLFTPLIDGVNRMTQTITSQIGKPVHFVPSGGWTNPSNPVLQGANSIMSEIRIKPNDGKFSYKTIPNGMSAYTKKFDNLLERQQQTVLKNDVLKKTLPILWFPLPMQQSISNSNEDREILNSLLIFERELIMELLQLQDIAKVANTMKKSQGNLDTAKDAVTLSQIPIHKITMEDIEKAVSDKHFIRVLHQQHRNRSDQNRNLEGVGKAQFEKYTNRSPNKRQINPDNFAPLSSNDLMRLMTYAYRKALGSNGFNYQLPLIPTTAVRNANPFGLYGLLPQNQHPQNYWIHKPLLNPQHLKPHAFGFPQKIPIVQQPQLHFFKMLNDTVPSKAEKTNFNVDTTQQVQQTKLWQNPSNPVLPNSHPHFQQNEQKSQAQQLERNIQSDTTKVIKKDKLEAGIAELLNSNSATSQQSSIIGEEQQHQQQQYQKTNGNLYATPEYTKLEQLQHPQLPHQPQYSQPQIQQTTTQATTTTSSVPTTTQMLDSADKVRFRDVFGEVFDNIPDYKKSPPIINYHNNRGVAGQFFHSNMPAANLPMDVPSYRTSSFNSHAQDLPNIYTNDAHNSNSYGNSNINSGFYRMAVGDDEILEMLRQHNALPPSYPESTAVLM